jgi:anti-sigma factor RsiW
MFHLNDRLLEKLIDGSASGSDVHRIRNHTESCRACARRLEEWRDNYQELDQHFPELATESGPAATVTPGGLVLMPSVEEPRRRWELELSTLLWIATVLMALLVGYGASRLRQPNEGMAVANRGTTQAPAPGPAPARGGSRGRRRCGGAADRARAATHRDLDPPEPRASGHGVPEPAHPAAGQPVVGPRERPNHRAQAAHGLPPFSCGGRA